MHSRTPFALALVLLATLSAAAPGARGAAAGDFPPGAFSDNYGYRLEDFEGKVLVLFFYEQACPTCRGTIPQRNEVVQAFRDAPVRFIAVAAGDTLQEARMYAQGTGLAMPVFADPLSVMETRYGTKISLRNIYQVYVIGPTGNVVAHAMTKEAIAAAVKDVKWKFKDQGYDPKLATAVNLLEWNQWEAGMRLLRPQLKSSTKTLAESAKKLFAAVKVEGEQWKAQAEKLAETEPAKAFDLYQRIATVFADDELGKSVAAPLKKLAADKAVLDEQAARKMYLQLNAGMGRVTRQNVQDVAGFAQQIVKKYPTTPTGARVAEFIKDLERAFTPSGGGAAN